MQVKSLLKAGAAAVVAGGMVLSAGVASAADEVRWKMASAFPSKLVQLGSLGTDLADNLGAISGGEFQVKFFEPNALVPPLEMFDAVAAGSVDAAWSTPGYWYGKNSALALFSAVPFGPAAGEYAAWIWHGGGHELMDEIYAQYGIKSVICGVIAPEASGWFRKPINSPEDLAGLKMRFFGLGAKVMEKMGVSTQLLAGADIYPALERGTIDATEFSMPAIDLNLGFYQVAKQYYLPGWHQQSTIFELMMNKEAYDALPDIRKAQIDVACKANFAIGLAEGEAIQAKALLELQEKGVTINRWPPEMLEVLEAKWGEVVEDEKANPDFAKSWESLQNFRKDYKVWSDLGYLN